ncbi:MAG: LysR family transcriptional regulator [Betaproteobacteria bacterium]|nr:LysR family transcriptional regulator [Betaproteobacteria bacterium]
MNSQPTPSPTTQAFDWNLIRAFLAVVESGSLTGAAKILAASQPTLSRQIGELELRVGAALFERVARGLRLTQAGEALVAPARQMQLAAQALSLTALGQSQQVAGTVRLTASEMTSAYLLPEILAGLRRAQPEIQIELVASNRIENLLERQADIAIRHTRPSQGGLIARRIGELGMGAYASAEYLARVGGKVDARRPQAYDWIGYDSTDLLLRGFRKAGIPVSRELFGFRCDNHIVDWEAAVAGVGIGFAPNVTAKRWPKMRSVLPKKMVPPMPVWLTVHRELRSSLRIQRVFDALAAGLLRLVD